MDKSPSDKVERIIPDTTVTHGCYGSFDFFEETETGRYSFDDSDAIFSPKDESNQPSTSRKVSNTIITNACCNLKCGMGNSKQKVHLPDLDDQNNPLILAERCVALRSPMENIRLALTRTNPIPDTESEDPDFGSPDTAKAFNKSWPPDKPDVLFGSPPCSPCGDLPFLGIPQKVHSSSANMPWSIDKPDTAQPQTKFQTPCKPSANNDSFLSICEFISMDSVFNKDFSYLSPIATSTPEKNPKPKDRSVASHGKFSFQFPPANSTIPGYLRIVNSTEKGNTTTNNDIAQLQSTLDSVHTRNIAQQNIIKQLNSPSQQSPGSKHIALKSFARKKLFMSEDEEAVYYLVTKYLNTDSCESQNDK